MTGTLHTARAAATAALAAIGIAACVGGIGYGLFNEDGTVGTGLLPAATGGLVAVLALADIAQSLLAARRERTEALDDAADATSGDAPEDGVDALGRTQRRRGRNLAVVVGLVFAAALLVPLIGLLLSLGLLMLAIAIGVERMKPLPAVAVTACALACIWLVFAQGLHVPFPTGMLGAV